MKRIAGYLFYRDDNQRLSYRKSWWSYAVGCVIAAVVFLAVLLVLWSWRNGRTFYVGAGRHTQGTPVAPADQTWGQFVQSTVCQCLLLVPLLFLAVAYIFGGSDEQRNPFDFDRQRNRVFYGPKELCKLSAIVAIRLVQTPRSGTGIFARLSGPPWSIELGCFRQLRTAQRFAEEISGFLNVGLYDDPIIPRPRRERGFDVITKDAVRVSPGHGSGREVDFGGPPPLRATPLRPITKPLVVTPAPRGSRLVASEVSRGAVRVIIRRNLPVAIISGVVLALMLVSFLTEGTSHAAWMHSIFPRFHNPKPKFGIAVALIVTMTPIRFLIGSLTMRVFNADNTALTRRIEGPFGRRSKRWARDEIAGIDVKSNTRSRGKGGGTYTVHTLELRRNAGGVVVLAGHLKPAELDWMCEMFSAALQLNEASNVQTIRR